MGIIDRIQRAVGGTDGPHVSVDATDQIGPNQHAVTDTVTAGDAIEMPIRLTGGYASPTVGTVEVTLEHVTDADDRTPVFEERVADGVGLEVGQDHRIAPTVVVPRNAPGSGDFPSRLQVELRVDGRTVDGTTGYLDVAPNPLVTAVRTELRVLGFSLSDSRVVETPSSEFWPEQALDGPVLRSMEFVPERGRRSRSPFTLVPVAVDGGLECYLTAESVDDWSVVTVEDEAAPAERMAPTLDRLGLRDP